MNKKDYIHQAGLERCQFNIERGGDCDVCTCPNSGDECYVKMFHGPDGSEAEYYICSACVEREAKNYTSDVRVERCGKIICDECRGDHPHPTPTYESGLGLFAFFVSFYFLCAVILYVFLF